MYYAKIAYKILLLLYFLAFASQNKANAQVVIGTPNLGFSQACASDAFNNFSTTFVFSPPEALEASNQFTIEMSNADGDFTNPTVVFTSNAGAITSSPATVNFSLPITTAGENYKIRVKSSAPVSTSAPSAAFAAYYKIQDSPFTINNLVSTAAFCLGGSYLLTIDNPGTGTNDSPLNYPNLTFNWFKETGPTTSVFVAEGPTLLVNEEGTYFVETNYGTCTSNSFSNRVTISEITSGEAIAGISSSLGNPFCPGQDMTILSTLSGNTYQWYKNGIAIPDATDQMYQTNESATYSVQVDLGECTASGEIQLVSELFEGTINVSETNSLEEGETLFVEITTTASAPEFDWYLNDELIPGESEATYEASEFGTYKVVVSETSGCIGSREFNFEIEEAIDQFPDVANIPNIVSPNGDGINDTWIIPVQYTSGSNTEVLIMNNQGKVILQTNDYQNNWPIEQLEISSVNQVYYYIITPTNQNTRKGSITVVK